MHHGIVASIAASQRANVDFKLRNDPLMNITNAEQAASQRANVDFVPLIDHFSALKYATKYATNQEKGSKAFGEMIALALNGGKRAEPEMLKQEPGEREHGLR